MNVAMFFEYSSIERDLLKYGLPSLKFEDLVEYLANPSEGRFFKSGFSYIALDKEQRTSMDQVISQFKKSGFVNRIKMKDDNDHVSFDVDIALDAFEIITNNNIDIISIYSSNINLIPLITRLQSKGYRVEIIGFSPNELSEEALGFIDLSDAIEDDLQYYKNQNDDQENNKDE